MRQVRPFRMTLVLLLLAGVLVPVFAAPVVSVPGLVGYWRLDEVVAGMPPTLAVDDSGNGNNGTWMGGVTGSTTVPPAGPPGIGFANSHSASFNGTDAAIDLGNPAALNITSAITVSAWLSINSKTAEKKAVARWSDSAGAYAWLLSIGQGTNDSPNFIVQTAGQNVVQSGVLMALSTWYHVVGTYDGANLNIYVNGVGVGMPPVATGPIATPATASTRIGAGSGTPLSGEEPFDGLIDDVRIYSRALSGTEVTALYNGALPGAFTLTATDAIGQNDLSWTASSTAATYSVRRGTAPGGPYTPLITTAGTTYSDTGVTVGTPYYYVIVASNVVGDRTTAEDSATPLPVPPKTNKSGNNHNIGHRCGCNTAGVSGAGLALALASLLALLAFRRDMIK